MAIISKDKISPSIIASFKKKEELWERYCKAELCFRSIRSATLNAEDIIKADIDYYKVRQEWEAAEMEYRKLLGVA